MKGTKLSQDVDDSKTTSRLRLTNEIPSNFVLPRPGKKRRSPGWSQRWSTQGGTWQSQETKGQKEPRHWWQNPYSCAMQIMLGRMPDTYIQALVYTVIQLLGNTLKHSMATTEPRLATFSKFWENVTVLFWRTAADLVSMKIQTAFVFWRHNI